MYLIINYCSDFLIGFQYTASEWMKNILRWKQISISLVKNLFFVKKSQISGISVNLYSILWIFSFSLRQAFLQ